MGFTGAHMLYVLDVFILALYLLSHVCALLEYTFQQTQNLVRIETDFHTVNVAILAVCVWGAFGVAPDLFSSDACTGFKGEGYPIVALWIENGGR